MLSVPDLHQFLLILLYSFLGTISMMVQDFSGTLLVIAEQKNLGRAAKRWDRAGDAAKFVMLCYSGENLMHMGWVGWLGVLPILYFGGKTTERSTSLAHEHFGGLPVSRSGRVLVAVEKGFDFLPAVGVRLLNVVPRFGTRSTDKD